MKLLREFIQDEMGLETVEYAIIVGIISAAAITAITALGIWCTQQFNSANSQLGAK